MQNKEIENLNKLYEGTTMGIDSINTISRKTNNKQMKKELDHQLDAYENHTKKLRDLIAKEGIEPTEIGMMPKNYARMNIAMQTLFDNSNSHIAEQMIQGTNMGIIEINKILNKSNDKTVISNAKEILECEQKYIDNLKTYL